MIGNNIILRFPMIVCITIRIIDFRNIRPVNSQLVSLLTQGEGWHNYHHVFPWDYRAAEHPYKINNSTLVIDFFGKIGN